MRLSELIKSADTAALRTIPEPPSSLEQKHQHQAPPEPAVPGQPVIAPVLQPSVNKEQMEEEIRRNLEKDFQARLSKTEGDARRFAEQRIREEEQKFQDRENTFMLENQKMLGELDDLRKRNEELILGVERLQREMPARFEMERKKIEEDLRLEMSAASARFAEEAKKKTNELEELRSNEKKIQEEFARKIEEEKVKVHAAAREEAARIARELQEKKLQENKARETSASSVPVAPVPVRSPVPVIPETLTFLADPVSEEKIRLLYEEIVRSADILFRQIAENKPLKLEVVTGALGALVDQVREKSAEMIFVVLEPYREEHYFAFHAANCALLSAILGVEFKLGRPELLELAMAALFHEAGLVNIRETLDYPKDLTPDMQEEIKRHPEKGARIFEGLVAEPVLKAILQHHETMNGKGYPEGLFEKDIHLYARIIQCVDSFEAMTHQRPYRKKPLEVSAAIKDIIETRRGYYDRDVLKALMSCVGLYPVMTLVELSNKQIARVVRQNRQYPLSPVVRIEFDETGAKLKSTAILDLKENQLVHIVGPLSPVVSFGTKKSEKDKKKKVARFQRWTVLKEIIPFLLIVALIAFFVYILLKI